LVSVLTNMCNFLFPAVYTEGLSRHQWSRQEM